MRFDKKLPAKLVDRMRRLKEEYGPTPFCYERAKLVEAMRPSVLFRPKLTMTNSHHPMWHEGKRWLVEYGDVMVVAETPDAAMREFDKKWVIQ